MPRINASGSSAVSISGGITANQNLAQVAGNAVTTGRTGQLLVAVGDPASAQNMNVDANGSAQVQLFSGAAAIGTAAAPLNVRIQPPNTAIKATVVALNAVTATKIPATPLANRKTLLIKNIGGGGVVVTIGDSSVTAGVGYTLADGVELASPWSIGPSVDVYAISASATPNIVVVETS